MPMIRRPGATPGEPSPPGEVEPGGLTPLQVPEDTTPTWELEMLVSGAVLFGLFQLPPVIDEVWRGLMPRLTSQVTLVMTGMGYSLVKAMVYALIVAFVVHLASRAYWVALVGLDSVFPKGIRWDGAVRRRGFTREEIEQMVRPLPALIARIDNFCSVVFAVGFLAVSLAVTALLAAATAATVAWLLSLVLLPGGVTPQLVFAVLFAMVFVPRLLRRLVLTRLDPASRGARVLHRLLGYSFDALVLRSFGSLTLTLTSNIRRSRIIGIALTLLMASFVVAFMQMFRSRGNPEADVYPGLPETLGAHATNYLHYADQRVGADAFVPVAFIQSDVIRDPYVRLFIPFIPRKDGEELRACMARPASGPAHAAGATPVAGAGTAATPPAADAAIPPAAARPPVAAAASPPVDAAGALAVGCLARIHAATLDGRPLQGLDFEFSSDAASGLQGILAHIPVGDLPHGRHELGVRRPPPPREDGPGAPTFESIPFWL